MTFSSAGFTARVIRPNADRLRLRRRSIDALRILPGAMALHEFGSASNGTPDAFSDIDLQVVTTDLARSVSGRTTAYTAIAPVLIEWAFLHTPSSWAATVLFEGMSPFCHLDVGFTIETSAEKDSMLEGSTLHWTQAPAVDLVDETPAWLSPKTGTIEHVMIGELLGLVRYAKARKRNQDLLCWKFFSALANRVLEAEYLAVVDADRGFIGPLWSHEHTLLRKAHPADAARALARCLLCADAIAMDRSVVDLAHRLVHRCQRIAPVSDTCMRQATAMLQWLELTLAVQDSPDALSRPRV